MPNTRTIDGFSYLEVLIASALVAAAIVPVMQSLTSAVGRWHAVESAVEHRHHLRGLMEMVLAEPYETLLDAAEAAGDGGTATGYSDPIGAERRRLVFIARYDGDSSPYDVPDPDLDDDGNPFTNYRGLLWIRTAGEEAAVLESLRAP